MNATSMTSHLIVALQIRGVVVKTVHFSYANISKRNMCCELTMDPDIYRRTMESQPGIGGGVGGVVM